MSPVHEAKSHSTKRVLLAIAAACVALAVGLGAFVFLTLKPRGEKVGELNLIEPDAVLPVRAKVGDTLVFHVDAKVGLPQLGSLKDEEAEQQANRQLMSSRLTVRATSPSGAERTATCAVYRGRATSTSIAAGALSRVGMLTDCVLDLDEAGEWSVRGAVAWSSDLTLQNAALEVRLEG
jgi:hypothetical protein